MDSGDSTGEPTRVRSPSLARFTPWLHQHIDYDQLDIDDEPDQLQRAQLKPPVDTPTQSPTPPVVAVKRPTLPDGTTLARSDHRAFLQEAQTWAAVHDHPYIPTVIGWDDDPHPWLAVEYADHGSLAEHTGDTDGQLGVHHAVWTVQCLAKALDHAHARDHYHQDVTTYNVLLFASEDGWPVPKLGDWGLARARNDQSSQSFTPGYGAPEQRRPNQYHRVHPRKTDLYQLGTILYELLTGKMPFPRHERDRKHRDSPSPPSHHRETITEDGPLDTLVTQLLAPDPNERPHQMAQVVTRLATCREQLSTNDPTTPKTDTSELSSDTTGSSEFVEETPLSTDKTAMDTSRQNDAKTRQNSLSNDRFSNPKEVEVQLSVESMSIECKKRVVIRDSASNSRVIVNHELQSQREENRQCELTDQLPPGVGREDISVTEAPETGELTVEQPTVKLTTQVAPGETIVWEYSVEFSAERHLRYLQAEPQLETTTPAPANWRMFQATVRRGGAGGGHTGPNPPVTTRWQFNTYGNVGSSAAVADGTVYVGSNADSLYAVDATTGNKQWQLDTSQSVKSSPAIVDGTVYVGSWDTNLYAVDAVTGNQEWQFNTDGWVESSPAVVDGTVYVGSGESLYAIDAATGYQQWQFDTSGIVFSSPAVTDGTVYVGSKDESLYAVGAATGNKRWQFDTSGEVCSSPAVMDGTVYVGSHDENLYAVDVISGKKQWQFDTNGKVISSPAVVDDTVYVGSHDASLYAVDAATGTKQWQFDTDGQVYSSPAVVDDTVYVGSGDESLYAVDAVTGEKQWQFNTSAGMNSSPAVVDGTVYVGNNDGNLYAVEEEG